MTARNYACNYESLALSWIPDSQEKRSFHVITAIIMAVAFTAALIVSSITVPEKERAPRTEVPERVAKFITQKKQLEPPKPAPTPIPTPLPTPKPKPKVERQPEQAEQRKPLTEVEQKARATAAKSGLLALSNDIADLIDTSAVDQQLGASVRKSTAAAQQAAGVSTDALTSGLGQGSGGVSTEHYLGGVGSTQLSSRDADSVKASLDKGDELDKPKASASATRARAGNIRTEEEVTIIFDQNKGQLFSIYNRERRSNPGLKGKLVLEITIAPDGSVTKVTIASSELNNPALERRIIARVKQFQFGARAVEPVTVTFPIEFLPS